MSENIFEFDESVEQSAIIHIVGIGKTGLRAVGKMVGRIHKVECLGVQFASEDFYPLNTLPMINLSETTLGGDTLNFTHFIKTVQNSDLIFLVADLNDGINNLLWDICTAVRKPYTAVILVVPETLDDIGTPIAITEQVTTLRTSVDGVILVSSRSLIPLNLYATKVFDDTAMHDYLLRHAIEKVTDIITTTSFMCMDFADVLTIIKGDGIMRCGTGIALGKERGIHATEKAFNALKLQGIGSIIISPRLLCCITGSNEMTMEDYNNVNELLHSAVSEDSNIKIGVTRNDEMGNILMVTIWVVESDRKY